MASNESVTRRSFLSRLLGVAMAAGLAAAYGTLAAVMARFLYPAKPTTRRWMFVTNVGGLQEGDSFVYHTPAGAPVNITRLGSGGAAEGFVALSSRCPHLGCQVHWQAQNNRFFCPCHNGIFDPSGVAVAGPPAEAGQSLPQFPLKVEHDLLYIEVPLETA
jgi:Rieske Fe-S protein